MISPDPYNELKFLGLLFISYILYQIGKFLSNSEMVHVQVSNAVQHLVGMTADALFLKKKNAITSQIHNAKKCCTVIQGQNEFNFSCGNNGKKISSTFFLSHQNITSFD